MEDIHIIYIIKIVIYYVPVASTDRDWLSSLCTYSLVFICVGLDNIETTALHTYIFI